MLDRVDRMLIAVRSRNLAAATFASMLGAQPDRDSRSACLNAHRLVMRVGESELELCEPAGPGPVPGNGGMDDGQADVGTGTTRPQSGHLPASGFAAARTLSRRPHGQGKRM